MLAGSRAVFSDGLLHLAKFSFAPQYMTVSSTCALMFTVQEFFFIYSLGSPNKNISLSSQRGQMLGSYLVLFMWSLHVPIVSAQLPPPARAGVEKVFGPAINC